MPRLPSVRAHEEVLTVALKLIADRGVDGVSVDAISEASGVSKATIYKHWTNKEALCLEAIGNLQSGLPVETDTGDVRAEIVKLLRHLAEAPRPRALMRIMPKILGHASSNPKFAKAWGERIEQPRRTRLIRLIERAAAAGELGSDTDVELAVHMLLGPVLYHRMMRTAMPPRMLETIVEFYWKANAPRVQTPVK
ncbi:MAG: TetR family transcriptional regulator [Terriglobia bacterium]|nr:MAG: TetR family transcriptional regulator [Terriglobia bacterium]